MADSNRHWKESIGVVPGMSPKRGAAPGTSSGTSTTTSSGVVLPTLKPPTKPTPQRETITPNSSEESILSPIENLIDALPSGSITFADQVQQKLWQRPTPIEIRALGVIAAEKALAPPAVRKQAVRVVAVRQRIGRLLFTPLVTIDSEHIAAIGGEWVRLANLVREMRRQWPSAVSGTAEERVLRASYDLLADPFDLEVQATLAAEMARLVEAIRNGNAAGTPVWNAPVTEVDELVGAIGRGVLAADQGLCLELFAGCTLAQRHVNENERGALERDRRLLELLAGQLETRVDVMLTAHSRDPASIRRLAAWRRYLTETRSRVNEAMTRPADTAAAHTAPGSASEVHITAPQGTYDPVENTVAVTAPAAESAATAAAAPEGAREEPIVEHLRAVRSSVREGRVEAPAPVSASRWALWLPFAGGVVAIMAVVIWTSGLPRLLDRLEPLSPEQFESALPLIQTSRAGGLLVATVDPEWTSMSTQEQQLGATRLMALAEESECAAGLLVDADGTPLAVWSPGRPPLLRHPLRRRGDDSWLSSLLSDPGPGAILRASSTR